ncbi:MAG: PKD domain-containing protein [Chitinophagales bacterium]
MKQYIALTYLLLSFCTYLPAQISSGGTPYSFTHSSLTSKVPTASMPSINLAALKAEDALNDGDKQVFRFGKSIEVNFNLDNAGVWETLKNGDKLWRLQIFAKGAKTINLIYNDFYLPKGAKLFLYNADKSEVIGAFTERNNKPYRKFSTTLLKGDKTILEYYEPANVAGKGIVQISEVIHGYRGFEPTVEKGYGDSGGCNVNINCSEGNDWQIQKRAVAMIIAGGKRDCTGALVNNVRQDGTPYLLTANHCLPNNLNEVQTWLFMFNYESLSCIDEDGRTDQTVSGSILRASSADSDFALVELSEIPPIEYGVYFAGWSAENVAAIQSTCIHHPAGDIKKITFNENPLVSDNIGGTPLNSFWKVTEWEKGTTEGGSSGSPLFDPNKRIVGQLYGGFASCFNSSWDKYGKFSYSWNSGDSNASRLKDWLDPDNTGTLIIDGVEGNAPKLDLDASILSIASPDKSICGAQSINPVILFRNVGAQSLTSISFLYSIDGSTNEMMTWEGNLDFFDSEWVALPPIEVEAGTHTLVISIQNPNGELDMNETNNVIMYDFEVLNGTVLKVDLNTDRFGSETSFQIKDDAGNIVVERTNFDSDRKYNFDFCLTPDCYVFTIFDSFEGPDGLGDGICCQNGNGSYMVGLEGGIVFGEGGEFRSSESVTFCIEDKLVLQAAFSADQTEVCSGDAVQFTALSGAAATYAWVFEGGTPAISAEPNPLVVFENWGDFNVSLKVTNSVSEDELEVENYIRVNGTNLDILTFNASNPIIQDGGVELDISSSSSMENLTFNWSNGATIANPDKLTRGNYSVVVTDANGCSTKKNVFIDSDILPIVAMIQTDKHRICEGESIVFEDVSNNKATVRQWEFFGAETVSSNDENPVISYLQPGIYSVRLIVSDAYTTDTLTLNNYVEVGNIPDVVVQTTPPEIGKDNGTIKLTVENASPATTYQWNIGGPTSSERSNLAEGAYTVIVTNEKGCQKTLEIPLKTAVEAPDGFLVYPNPVSDGTLYFYNNNPSDIPVSFKIYSLEGRLVGEWSLDGNNRNYYLDIVAIPSGVYLLWSNIGGKERQEKVILLND